MSGNLRILEQITRLQTSAVIHLYVLDATALGGGILRFAPTSGAADEPARTITWRGEEYTPWPIEAAGFELKSQGTLPRPQLRVANVMGTFTALCLAHQDMVGARFIRKRTFAVYLDGSPTADPLAAFPDDIFRIEKKSYEDKNSVEFELVTSLELEGVNLPRRTVQSQTCSFQYRDPYCGFAKNKAIANSEDVAFPTVQRFKGMWGPGVAYEIGDVVFRQLTPIIKRYYLAHAASTGVEPPVSTYWREDLCSLTLRGCKRRFNTDPLGLPFGGFPGTNKGTAS